MYNLPSVRALFQEPFIGFSEFVKVFQGNKFKKLRNSDFFTKTPILLKLGQIIGEILMKILSVDFTYFLCEGTRP